VYSLLILAVSSFCVAFVLTPLARDLALRRGFVDQPDRIRKFHARPVPRVGGISIFIAYLVSFAVLLLLPLRTAGMVLGHLDFVRNLIPAATVVFFTGTVDDLLGLKPWQKCAAQFAAAIEAVWAGVQINGVGGQHLPSWCAIPVSVVWLVGCTNAFNLIDGVDGLATGVGLVAAATTFIAALLEHNVGLAIAVVPLAGALLGILRFNFSPASIFLGDSGSLFIGFLLGCCTILWSQKSISALGMSAPLIVLSIPLLDTGLAVVRRFLRRRPIFGADHSHIHHRLLARGLTPRQVVILLYAVCGFCAAIALLERFAHGRLGGAIIVLFFAGAWIGVRHLRYPEFEIARRMIHAGNFRRHLNAELQLSAFRDNLAAAVTPDQCWEVLKDTYGEFGFDEIRFQLKGHLYTHTINGHRLANTWAVRIQLSENAYLNLRRQFDRESPPIVARFTDAIGKILRSKTSKMLGTETSHAEPAVNQAPGNGAEKPLQPIAAMIRNS
jgi:UDP-GlcNAc:undecaprenyl-phosphate/decaprenyl-phosphate GlcNAc-1-phosphate transferase